MHFIADICTRQKTVIVRMRSSARKRVGDAGGVYTGAFCAGANPRNSRKRARDLQIACRARVWGNFFAFPLSTRSHAKQPRTMVQAFAFQLGWEGATGWSENSARQSPTAPQPDDPLLNLFSTSAPPRLKQPSQP